MTTIIECPICNWQPDGEAQGRCSCGHSWNTFETKGQCPECNTCWWSTNCPNCENDSPYNDWYIDAITKAAKTDKIAELMDRKKRLESRLVSLGIKNYRPFYLPYIDYTKEDFQSPYDVGCRLIILYAIYQAIDNIDMGYRYELCSWLTKENLWDKVSNYEKEILEEVSTSQHHRYVSGLSWYLESSLLLCWVLNIYKNIHDITSWVTEEQMEIFKKSIPEFGGETKDFLNNLKFRRLEEIYEENLLNELVTKYFLDLYDNRGKNDTQINEMENRARLTTLHWVRKFRGINKWDDSSRQYSIKFGPVR